MVSNTTPNLFTQPQQSHDYMTNPATNVGFVDVKGNIISNGQDHLVLALEIVNRSENSLGYANFFNSSGFWRCHNIGIPAAIAYLLCHLGYATYRNYPGEKVVSIERAMDSYSMEDMSDSEFYSLIQHWKMLGLMKDKFHINELDLI